MVTPRLRNALRLYLRGYLTKIKPSTFDKLRENILLDSFDRDNAADKLNRYYNKLLALLPINRDNEDLEKSNDTSNQILALQENNIEKFKYFSNAYKTKLQKIIDTFKLIEESGILDEQPK